MNLANGLFGLGGLSGATGTSNVPGLLGKYYNPADAKKAKVKQGLLQAGIALLSQRPQLGDGIGQTLGTALRGGMEGAQQAEQDYMNNAMMGYNMDRQSQDDAWQAKTRERQQHAWDSEDQANEARKAFYSALPEDQKRLAQAYPDQFGQLYLQKSMGEGEKPTSDMREYEVAKQQGFEGSFMDYMTAMKKAGATNVNVNGDQKLTEGQSKDLNFYSRGKFANADLEKSESSLLSLPGNVAGSAGVIGNYFKDPNYRQAERAGREVLAVILRKDTGAAVTQDEFDLYGPMYLPWPGDDAQTVADKRDARARAIGAIRLGGGTARPLFEQVDAEFSAQNPAGASPLDSSPIENPWTNVGGVKIRKKQ